MLRFRDKAAKVSLFPDAPRSLGWFLIVLQCNGQQKQILVENVAQYVDKTLNVARKFSIEEVPPNLYLCITSNGMVQSTVTWANSTGEEKLADIHQLPACTCDHRFARLIPGPPPCACILITAGMRSIAPERLVHRKFHRLNYHQHLSSLMGEWTFAHKDGLQVNPARLPPDNVPNKPGRPKKKRMERMKVAPGRPP